MMKWLRKTNAEKAVMRSRKYVSLLLMLQGIICGSPGLSRAAAGDQGSFMVTGHLHRKDVEAGVKQPFLDKAIPFINGTDVDFLVLTGDLIFGYTGAQRSPGELLQRQYDNVLRMVFNRIRHRIYSLAGNHDTGYEPHPFSVELFEKKINPLRFSFRHRGSLFLFLSLYEPFPHVEMATPTFRFQRIWDNYDTAASHDLLDTLRGELDGVYDHIFIFVHISPVSDYPIGYYWSTFLVPLLAHVRQDVHIFSTDHFARRAQKATCAVRYHNIRFYSYANFPRGGYLVHFDDHHVEVELLQGEDFIPSPMEEVDYQPATRLSLLRTYCSFRLIEPVQRQMHDYYEQLLRYLMKYMEGYFSKQ